MSNGLESDAVVANCIFRRNTTDGSGGAMWSHGKSPQFKAARPQVYNCVFAGNTAVLNGGAWFSSPDGFALIKNCTFFGNSASSGGGIYVDGDSFGTRVDGCVFWNDSPNEFKIFNGSAYGDLNIAQGGNSVSNPTGVVINAGDVNPMFVDAAGSDNIPGTEDDDLHVLPGSPSIDGGSNFYVPPDLPDLDGDGNTTEPTPLDLDGHTRILDDPATVDTGIVIRAEGPPVIDIGVYKYVAGDGDRNGVTDLVDYNLFAGCVTGPNGGVPPECIAFDMNADGAVDQRDFSVLQIAFAGSP